MGKNESKPYVIDDFDSLNETDNHENTADVLRNYLSTLKDVPRMKLSAKSWDKIKIQKKQTQYHKSRDANKNLKKLVKLLNKNDFEEAKNTAKNLIVRQVLSATNTSTTDKDKAKTKNTSFIGASHFSLCPGGLNAKNSELKQAPEVFPQADPEKSSSSSAETSSWSSKSEDWITVSSSSASHFITAENKSGAVEYQQEVIDNIITEQKNLESDKSVISLSKIPFLTSSVSKYQIKETTVSNTQQVSPSQSSVGCFKVTDISKPLSMDPSTGWVLDTEEPKNCIDHIHETHENTLAKAPTDPSPGSLHKSFGVDNHFGCYKESCQETMKYECSCLRCNNVDEPTASNKMNCVSSTRIKRSKSPKETNAGKKSKSNFLKMWNKSDLSMSSLSKSGKVNYAKVVRRDPSKCKVLDLNRWYCIVRPQYRTSSGVSSLVSCWNFLFSTSGHGSLRPVTQESALMMLGFTSPFDEINFSTLADNLALFRWFFQLNNHFGVSGKCSFMYKPLGKNKTKGMTSENALSILKDGLKDTKTTFIYHCYKHYVCLVGYDDTLGRCMDSPKNNIGDNAGGNSTSKKETWVLIGDTSRKFPSIHCVSWEDICLDLECRSPNYFDIRHKWKGVRQTGNKSNDHDNCHCILTFQRCTENISKSPSTVYSFSTYSSTRSSLLKQYQDSPSSSFLPYSSNTAKCCLSIDGYKSDQKIKCNLSTDTLKPEQSFKIYPTTDALKPEQKIKNYPSNDNLKPEQKMKSYPSNDNLKPEQKMKSYPSNDNLKPEQKMKSYPSNDNLKPEQKIKSNPSNEAFKPGQIKSYPSNDALKPEQKIKSYPSNDNLKPEQKMKSYPSNDNLKPEQNFKSYLSNDTLKLEQNLKSYLSNDTLKLEQNLKSYLSNDTLKLEQNFKSYPSNDTLKPELNFKGYSSNDTSKPEQKIKSHLSNDTLKPELNFKNYPSSESLKSEQNFKNFLSSNTLKPEQNFKCYSLNETLKPEQNFKSYHMNDTLKSEQNLKSYPSNEAFIPEQNFKSYPLTNTLKPEMKIKSSHLTRAQLMKSYPSTGTLKPEPKIKSFPSTDALKSEQKIKSYPSNEAFKLEQKIKSYPSTDTFTPKKIKSYPSNDTPKSKQKIKSYLITDIFKPEQKNVTNAEQGKGDKIQSVYKTLLRGGSLNLSSPCCSLYPRSLTPFKDKSEQRSKSVNKEHNRQRSPHSELRKKKFQEIDSYDYLMFDIP